MKRSKAKNQSLCAPKINFSGEGLTDDEWKHHIPFVEPTGSMLTSNVHVFSNSVSALVQVHWMHTVLLLFGRREKML